MRLLIIIVCLALGPFAAYAQRWDPEPYMEAGSIRFHDDLDFYLTDYSKAEIKQMRKEVSMLRMNFDKLIRATIKDIQSYSEGGNLVKGSMDFTLPDITTGHSYHLKAHDGKLRAFMFGSMSNPPARAQLPLWDLLLAKYDTSNVELFLIYGKELHPGDKKSYRAYPVPNSQQQKNGYAEAFAKLTKLPVLVDGVDNATLDHYGRVPNGAYVLDREGRMIFRGTWADSRKIEQILDTVLKWEADGKPRIVQPR